jgi:CheY-like chemotaxis protein
MPPPPQPVRVLLIDDDPDTREMYAEHLQFIGMSVSMAATALQALGALAVERPDVIVTDLHLRGMSGVELARAIKGNPATASIRVVLLTGDAFHNPQAQGRDAGCDEVCLKPCLPDALGEIILGLVRRAAA